MRTSSKKSIVNEQIDAEQVRLVGEEGEQLGIVTISEAREKAAAIKLDLVLISPEAEPPVCKLMDYGKHIFEAKKTKSCEQKEATKDPGKRD
jgi:translation initiation factor IF-3